VWTAVTATASTIRDVADLAVSDMMDDERWDYLSCIQIFPLPCIMFATVIGSLCFIVEAVGLAVSFLFGLTLEPVLDGVGSTVAMVFSPLPDGFVSGVGNGVLYGCFIILIGNGVSHAVMALVTLARKRANNSQRTRGEVNRVAPVRSALHLAERSVVDLLRLLPRILLFPPVILLILTVVLGLAYNEIEERQARRPRPEWVSTANETIGQAQDMSPGLLLGLVVLVLSVTMVRLVRRRTADVLRRWIVVLYGLSEDSLVRRIGQRVLPVARKGDVEVIKEIANLATASDLSADERHDAVRERMGSLTSRDSRRVAGQYLLRLGKERRQDRAGPPA